MAKALEELMYDVLTKNVPLTSKLAEYGTQPAVFETQAPNDKDDKWGDKQFPRIIYSVITNEDHQRRVNGSIIVDILTKQDETGPEVIELLVKSAINTTFFETDRGTTCLRWRTTANFVEPESYIIGVSVIFDMIAFPCQEVDLYTVQPDPVRAIFAWLKTKLGSSNAYWIEGTAQSTETWQPTAIKPAIYIREERNQVMKQLMGGTMMKMSLYCHIIAPLSQDRHHLLRTITYAIADKGYFSMADGGKFTLFNEITCSSKNDPVITGQINLTGIYFYDRTDIPCGDTGEKINHANFELLTEEEGD